MSLICMSTKPPTKVRHRECDHRHSSSRGDCSQAVAQHRLSLVGPVDMKLSNCSSNSLCYQHLEVWSRPESGGPQQAHRSAGEVRGFILVQIFGRICKSYECFDLKPQVHPSSHVRPWDQVQMCQLYRLSRELLLESGCGRQDFDHHV